MQSSPPMPLSLFVLTALLGLVVLSLGALPPRYYYFIAKAVLRSTGEESDPSNEVVFQSRSNCCRVLTLAWDYPYANTDLFFRVYWGRKSGDYTNRVSTTNLWATVELWPVPKTNLVITTTTTGTNLACANELRGPWYLLNRTTFTVTNPTLWPVFYRGVGPASNRVSQTVYWY